MQVYQFRSRSIVAYHKRESKSSFRSVLRQQSIDNFKKQGTYSGLVTEGSQKRLTRALENLCQIAQPKPFTFKRYKQFGLHRREIEVESTFKLNFVTLTLYSFSRRIPGKEAHKCCLEPLLRWLRGKGMTAYVWKAELQSKREDCHQLHYHLTTDVYIDYFELQSKWNDLQRNAGYLDTFFEKFGHWQPNSTDVHATHNKKNLIGYLTKAIVRYSDKKHYRQLRSKYLIVAEMAKADQNKETVEGKIWDCSQNIKVSFFEIKDYHDVTRRIATACMVGEMQKKEFERCTVYQLTRTARDAATYLPWTERQFYEDRLQKMRTFERLKPDINSFSTS